MSIKSLLKRIAFLLLTLLLTNNLSTSYAANSDALTIGIKQSPPFIYNNENGELTGLCIDIWKKVSDSLNQPYRFKEMELPELLKAIEDKSIDLSIVPLTVTTERVRQFYFSQPFFITTLAIATNKTEDDKISTFISNFFSVDFFKIIGLLFLIIMFFGFLVWFFERRYNQQQFRKGIRGVFDGIWWASVTMTTVGYGDKSPVSFWGRLFSVIWMFTAVIIISSFTATISSALTVNKMKGSIEGLSDLYRVKVGSLQGSSSGNYLDDNRIGFESFSTIEAGLLALQANQIKAFVYDKAILDFYLARTEFEDKLLSFPINSNKEYFSFASGDKEIIHKINPFLVDVIESKEWGGMLKKYGLQED